ncbi:MAG: membrane protein insertase YidC [Gammaproteobacteria bacterium]
MDTRRIFLYLALGLILLLIWTNWQSDHAPPPSAKTPAVAASTVAAPAQGANAGTANQVAATVPAGTGATLPGPARLSVPGGPRITIHTDVLDLDVALHGAVIIRANLLKFAQSKGSQQTVALLSPERKDFLAVFPQLAGVGLPAQPQYTAGATDYRLAHGEKTLRVPLVWHGGGITVTRTLILTRGSYEVRLQTEVTNTGGESAHFTPGIRIVAHNPISAQHFWDHFLPKYWATRGPAYYDGSYNQLPAESLATEPLEKTFSGGWIASVNQYFAVAAIPGAKAQASYFGRAVDDEGYDIGYRLPPFAVAAGKSETLKTKLFLGPKEQGKLEQVAPGLSRTVDYGKATIISKPIFLVLSFIHGFVGNWGWAIILLVLLIKAIFYLPQRMSARSMAKMRKLQPRLKLLKERYKDDKQKLSQATMELYRKEGANPVSGCLPMLIQVPIFIGLFYVLTHSVELRQAPWILWIQDLSAPDPFYVLPILYGLITLVQFRLQPQAVDGAQAKMMMFMPLLFTFFYAIFPSGLVLYYLLNTILNVAIQWQVNRELGIPLNLLPKRTPKT